MYHFRRLKITSCSARPFYYARYYSTNKKQLKLSLVNNPWEDAIKNRQQFFQLKKDLQDPSVLESMKNLRPRLISSRILLAKYKNGVKQCYDWSMDKKKTRNHNSNKCAITWLRMCETEGHIPDIMLYTMVINKMSKSVKLNIMLFKEMYIKYDVQPNIVTLSSMLKMCANNGLYLHALYLFSCTKPMSEGKLFAKILNSQEITKISNSFGLQSDDPILLSLLNNIKPNVISCTIIIECLGKLKHLRLMHALFHWMFIECEIVPNTVFFNVMFDILAENGKISRIERIFDVWIRNKLLTIDESVNPDTVTINSMIKAYANGKQFKKAQLLFNQYFMKTDECSILIPTAMTFVHMINCATKSKEFEFALQYFNDMKVVFDVEDQYHICTVAVLHSCAANADVSTLIQIFDEVPAGQKNRVMYKITIRCLFINGFIDEAISVFNEAVQTYNPHLTYKSWMSTYSLDLHDLDLCTAVVSILYNFRKLINDLQTHSNNKYLDSIPVINIVTGVGKTLKEKIPLLLQNEIIFNPPIKSHLLDDNNPGTLTLDGDCVQTYIEKHMDANHDLKINKDQ